MIDEEKFVKKLDDQKVASWKNNYINYNLLNKELDSLIQKNKKDIKEQINEINEIKEIGSLDPEVVEAKKLSMSSTFEIKEVKLKEKNPAVELKKKKTLDNIPEISFNKLSKDFLTLLDRELDNFVIFFHNKENHLHQSMNEQISTFNKTKNNNDNDNDKKLEIIPELRYLSNLCKELMNYVYCNLMTLIRILYKFDRMFINVSYDYMKKYIKNGKLSDILAFNIIDKSLISIEDMFISIKKSLSNLFKTNKNEESQMEENQNIIFDNIKNSNKIHEQIFTELNKWEKYLGISLDLPMSNHNSVFANTSFIGDSILFSEDEIDKSLSRKMKFIDNSEENPNNEILLDNSNNSNDNSLENEMDLKDFVKRDNFGVQEVIVNFGVLFDPLDTFSYRTNRVLSKPNNSNLKLILLLAGFYSYSYILLVPDIIIYLFDYKIEIEKNKYAQNLEKLNILYLYGLTISFPLIGNIFAKKIYEKYFINYSYKKLLIISMFCLILNYILSFLGICLNSSLERNIIFVIIGRFFLGLSYLKQLTKIYIDNYVPKSNLVRTNEKYVFSIYSGYILGLFINFLYYYDWFQGKAKKKGKHYFYSNLICTGIIIGLSFNYNIIMIISILIQFKDRNNYDIVLNDIKKTLKKNIENPRNLISNKDNKNIINIRDENILLEKNEKNINQENLLSIFIENNKQKKVKYYKTIFLILLFVLFTTQYISENLLLLLPRLFTIDFDKYLDEDEDEDENKDKDEDEDEEEEEDEYDTYKIEKLNNLWYLPALSSLSYFISYCLQRMYLKNSYFQKIKKIILILILISMIIFTLCFFFICVKPEVFNFDLSKGIYHELLIVGGFCILIILNELYHVMVINFFIYLLPTEKFKLGFIAASTLINIVTKVARLIPSIILITYLISKKNSDKFIIFKMFIGNGEYYDTNINLCNCFIFGLQIIFLLINLILFISFYSYIQTGPVNRILKQM